MLNRNAPLVTPADVAAFCRGAAPAISIRHPQVVDLQRAYGRLARILAIAGAIPDSHPLSGLAEAIAAGLAEVFAGRDLDPPTVEIERAGEDVPWQNFDPPPRPRHQRED